MTVFLVITFMVAVGGLAAWTTYLNQVSSRELRELQEVSGREMRETQALFLAKLAEREKAAVDERVAVADRYETFLDKQAENEQSVAQIDTQWLASTESAVDADPDIDWEAEPS